MIVTLAKAINTVSAGLTRSKPRLTARSTGTRSSEADGRFYFKLVDGDRVLLQSIGFDSPKDAGARVGMLKRGAFDVGDTRVAIGDGVSVDEVHAALAALLAAEADKA